MEATTECLGRGGGGHTLEPHSPRIGNKCPPPPHLPQILLEFFWDWEGAQKCFILCDQTTGDLKSHHLQAVSHAQILTCLTLSY